MTDKVQKIRNEVERMHNLLPIMDGDNISINYADRICRTLEMYIDSLQEEPVSEDLGEYLNELSKQFPEVSFAKLSRIGVRVAKWQKEQMMKDAIEIEGGEFHLNFANAIISKGTAPFVKCKVKMIIIKED